MIDLGREDSSNADCFSTRNNIIQNNFCVLGQWIKSKHNPDELFSKYAKLSNFSNSGPNDPTRTNIMNDSLDYDRIFCVSISWCWDNL